MKRTFFGKVLTAFIVVALLITSVACGSSSNNKQQQSSAAVSSSTNSDTSSEETTAPQSQPVTIKMLQHTNQASNDAIKVLNQKFHEKYPNITVDDSAVIETAQFPQVIQTRLAAGDVDILEFSCFNSVNPDWAKGMTPTSAIQYIESGNILDLTDQPFVKNWPDTTVNDSMSYNGKVYNVTTGKNAFNGIYYNKDLFDKNGLKVPETWAEFITICKTLQSKGIAPMTSGGKDVWPMQMVFNGFANSFDDPAALAKGLWTGERKYNDPQTMKVFDRLAEFASYFEKGVMSVDYASVIGRFTAGKAAMMPDGTWQGANIAAADPNFKFGYFAIPGDEKGSMPPQLAGKYEYGFGAYAKTKYKDEVLKWFDFYSQKDIYAEFVNASGFIPAMDVAVSNAFINELAPINQKFQTNFEIIKRDPQGLGKYGGFQILQLKVLGGPIATTKELADLAQKDLETALAAIK